MVNAKIGPKEFLALQGNLSPPQNAFMPIDEPWEDGSGYARLGRKGKVERIRTWSEFESAVAAQQELVVYEGMKNDIWDIEIVVGDTMLIYPFYKILDVEDITDFPYSPTSASGLHYRLVVQWTVQQVTGVWGVSIGA